MLQTLEHLHKVMKKYQTVGLAAPQIGFPWQVFAIEVTEKALKDISPQMRNLFHMQTQPLTFFINPKLEIINPTELISHEICGSISCYQAEVPRAKEVQITALNRFGEPFCWKGKDWLARIAQHEMDHLHVRQLSRYFTLSSVVFSDGLSNLNFETIRSSFVHSISGLTRLSRLVKYSIPEI